MAQKDQAHYRRLSMQLFLLIAAVFLVLYTFFLISDGYRDILGLGHFSLIAVFILVSLAFFIGKPIYKLENPFQHSLDQKRKAK